MIAATVDTNILASGIAGIHLEASTPGAVIRAWQAGRFRLILSAHVLTELLRTLRKPYFQEHVTASQAERILALLAARATVTPLTISVTGIASHPEDDRILATAASGAAEYLVTGDRQLLALGSYRDVQIVSARAFLELPP